MSPFSHGSICISARELVDCLCPRACPSLALGAGPGRDYWVWAASAPHARNVQAASALPVPALSLACRGRGSFRRVSGANVLFVCRAIARVSSVCGRLGPVMGRHCLLPWITGACNGSHCLTGITGASIGSHCLPWITGAGIGSLSLRLLGPVLDANVFPGLPGPVMDPVVFLGLLGPVMDPVVLPGLSGQ